MDELWNQLTRGEPTLRWFARRSQSDGLAGGVLHSPLGLQRLVHNLAPSWDMYFGINRSSKRGAMRVCANDITHWQTVLFDIDPIDGAASPRDALQAYLDRASELLGMELPASLVVDSGRGVQAHIQLAPLELDSDDARLRVRLAVGALLRGVGSTPLFGCILDTSCSDLARVARMPLTINHKTGRRTALIDSGVASFGSAVATGHDGNVGDLTERILALANATSQRVDIPPVRDGIRWQQVWSRLTVAAQRFIQEGVSSPGRHVACVATVRSLREQGVPRSEAERAVSEALALCSPPLPWYEASRIITASYR